MSLDDALRKQMIALRLMLSELPLFMLEEMKKAFDTEIEKRREQEPWSGNAGANPREDL